MGYIATLMALTIRLRHLMAYTMSPIAWFLALICWTAGGLIYVRISEFGVPRFTGKDEMQGRGELIATGMHGEVRHPIYLGHLLMQLGWAVSSGSAAGFICVAVALATGAVMLQMEERELMQRFGDDYREYRKQVPMIIPRSAKIFRLPTDRNS
jgi:protein-S-isoprenylcysteine O-methyltransferase Ste14